MAFKASAVRSRLSPPKSPYIPAQADMPLEYDPGDAIQIDWGEATIYLRGERKTIQIFCGRLCCSCDIFVMTMFENQTMVAAMIDRLTYRSFVLNMNSSKPYRAEFAAQSDSARTD